MPPRQGYRSRTTVLAGLKASMASKPHAVHWRRQGERTNEPQDYAATCNCGWRMTGRYGGIKDAIRLHLYPEKE